MRRRLIPVQRLFGDLTQKKLGNGILRINL